MVPGADTGRISEPELGLRGSRPPPQLEACEDMVVPATGLKGRSSKETGSEATVNQGDGCPPGESSRGGGRRPDGGNRLEVELKRGVRRGGRRQRPWTPAEQVAAPTMPKDSSGTGGACRCEELVWGPDVPIGHPGEGAEWRLYVPN